MITNLLLNSGREMQTDVELITPNSANSRIQMARMQSAADQRSYLEGASLAIPAVFASMVDTFGTSLGLLDDDDVNNFLKRNLSSVAEFREDHESAVGAVADIAGVFIPGGVAMKAVRAGGLFAKIAQKTLGDDMARYITSTGLRNSELFQENFQAARLLASKGALRVDIDQGLRAMNRKKLRRSVGDVVIENVAADAAIAASMHESDFLFPDEISMTENLVFFGAFNAVFGAAGLAAARYTMRTGINKAAGSIVEASTNPRGLPMIDAHMNIVDQRGPALTMLAGLMEDTKQQKTLGIATNDEVIKQNAMARQAGLENDLSNGVQKLFGDSPIKNVTVARKLDGAAPELKTMLRAVNVDWLSLQGVRSLEQFGIADTGQSMAQRLVLATEGTRAEMSTLTHKINKLVGKGDKASKRKVRQDAKKLMQLRAVLDDLERTTAIVYEVDGTTSGALKRLGIFQDGERAIKRHRDGYSETTIGRTILRSDAEGNLDRPTKDFDPATILDEGTPHMKSEDFMQLSHMEKTAAHDLMQMSFERVAANIDAWEGTTVTSATHHTKLDFLAKLVEQEGNKALRHIKGIDSLEELYFASIGKKWEEFQLMRNEAAASKAKGTDHMYLDMDNVAKAINLPRNNHKILQIFEENRVEYKGKVPKRGDILPIQAIANDMKGIKQRLRESIEALPEDEIVGGAHLRGTMQDMPRDSKPVIGLLRNEEVADSFGRAELRAQTAVIRAGAVNVLDKSRAEFSSGGRQTKAGTRVVTAILDEYLANPDLAKSAKDSLRRVIQSHDYDTLADQFVTQAFKLRDVEAMTPLDLAADIMAKAGEKSIEHMLKSPSRMVKGTKQVAGNEVVEFFAHQEVFNKLLGRGGVAQSDLLSYSLARNALGHGWDIQKKVHQFDGPNGEKLFQFTMDAGSDRNKALYKEIHGEAMPEGGALIPNSPRDARPLTMTETAFRAVESMNSLSQQYLLEVNALRKARGLKTVMSKNWHMAPRDFTEKHLIFLLDDAGQHRGMVGGATAAQARAKAKKELEASVIPLTAVDETSGALYTEARGAAWAQMSDFSNPSKQTGGSTGKSFGAVAEEGAEAFQNQLEAQLRGFSDIVRETRTFLFEPELNFLKLQEKSAALGRSEGENVFSLLANRITGTQNLSTNSIPGKILIGAETAYDHLAKRVFDALPGGKIIPRKRSTEGFTTLQKRLGEDHSPFNDITEYLAKTQGVSLPGHMRKHAGTLNEITTALTIRIMDVGMMVINTMSLASTLPPVIKMLARQSAENGDEHLSRIAAFGSATPGGNGYFGATRAVTSGIHFMFSPEGRALAKQAKNKGYFDQFAAEQVELYARTGEQFIPGLLRSVSDKASILTDTSERLARATSFMTFLNIGKKGLGLQDEAAMAFAHKHANNVIADFRPSNRPAVFQGAAGMPFGLFTTFMWNYLQRLYSIVETRNVSAAINQFGLQAALFGGRSVPGAQPMLEQLGTAYGDGSENLVDRLHRAFGPEMTDLFMSGAISHFTGVGVAPRAAIGLPGSMGFGLERQAAGFRMAGKLMQTAGKEMDSVLENGGFNPVQMAEIMARANVNKMTSNLIEMALGRGQDARGNTIDEFSSIGEIIDDPSAAFIDDAKTQVAIASRVLGFKSHMSDQLRHEVRHSNVTENIQGELQKRLGESLRSRAYHGSLTSEHVEGYLSSYIKAGGRAENFQKYFTSQVVNATTDKASKEIAEALKRSSNNNQLARLAFLSNG